MASIVSKTNEFIGYRVPSCLTFSTSCLLCPRCNFCNTLSPCQSKGNKKSARPDLSTLSISVWTKQLATSATFRFLCNCVWVSNLWGSSATKSVEWVEQLSTFSTMVHISSNFTDFQTSTATWKNLFLQIKGCSSTVLPLRVHQWNGEKLQLIHLWLQLSPNWVLSLHLNCSSLPVFAHTIIAT